MYKIKMVPVDVRGETYERDVIDHPGSVCVLALTAEDQVILVRQQRPGMGRQALELPGGRLRPGEAPEDAARREMETETGLRPSHLTLLCAFYPAPGYSTEECFCFVARGLAPGRMQYDANEDLMVEFRAFDAAMAAVKSGEIVDARSVVTLLRWGSEEYDKMRPMPKLM